VEVALDRHELIKIKFIEHKEKTIKNQLVEAICQQTHCSIAGLIGHTAIVYRPSRKKDRRKIQLP
jgi:RNA-binding protein